MKKIITLYCILLNGIAMAQQVHIPFQAVSAGVMPRLSEVGAQKHVGALSILGGSPVSGFYSSSNFTFRNSPVDNSAPLVNSPTTQFVLIKNNTAKLTVIASDNVGVVSAKIFYKPISATPEAYRNTFLEMLPNNEFGVDVPDLDSPDNWYDNMGMEYYFEIRDASNVSRFPATGTLQSFLRESDARIPASNLSFGSNAENYRIFSVPYIIQNNSIARIFTDLGTENKAAFRIYRYDTNDGKGDFNEYANFTNIERGRGYFIIIGKQTASFSNGIEIEPPSQDAPPNFISNLYQLSLKPGWNLIGNPYTVPINWEDVKAFNSSAELNSLYVYRGSYSKSDELNSFEGGFVYLDGTSETIITIPFKGQSNPQARTRDITIETIGAHQWKILFTAKQGQVENSFSGFGMHPSAALQKDKYDDLNPPGITSGMELQFLHPESKPGNFALDIVPFSDKHVWRFNVQVANPSEVELTWPELRVQEHSGVELYLFDIRKNTVVDMTSSNSYTFHSIESGEFKIYYGKKIRDEIAPDHIQISSPYPNPFNDSYPATIAVGLPYEAASSTIRFSVFTLTGVCIYTEMNETQTTLRQIKWNGNNNKGELVADGMYVYRIVIGNQVHTGQFSKVSQNH